MIMMMAVVLMIMHLTRAHLVICSIFLLCAYPTAVADLAKVASFSTETRFGKVGKVASSRSSPNLTELLFFANMITWVSTISGCLIVKYNSHH